MLQTFGTICGFYCTVFMVVETGLPDGPHRRHQRFRRKPMQKGYILPYGRLITAPTGSDRRGRVPRPAQDVPLTPPRVFFALICGVFSVYAATVWAEVFAPWTCAVSASGPKLVQNSLKCDPLRSIIIYSSLLFPNMR